jgi:hypothetical protein
MAASTQRIAALEAEVAQLRDQVASLAASQRGVKVLEAFGLVSDARYQGAVAASQPRPRHLRVLPGGAP